MLEIVYRPRAAADLDAIADYTKARWGETQAKKYTLDIRRQIMFAAEYPGVGSATFGLPLVYRKVASGHHRIIYRVAEARLIVVCVVHEREDIPDDLEDNMV